MKGIPCPGGCGKPLVRGARPCLRCVRRANAQGCLCGCGRSGRHGEMRSGYFIQCYDRLRHRRRAFRRVIQAVTGQDLPVEYLRGALLMSPPGSRPFERARHAVGRLLAAVETGQIGFYRNSPRVGQGGRRCVSKSLEPSTSRGIVTVSSKEMAG